MECNVGESTPTVVAPNEFIKNTPDWKKVSYALEVLHQHKKIVEEELDFLKQKREIACKDPIIFVQSLVDGKLDKFPVRKKIPVVPDIDFSKYVKEPVISQDEIKKEQTSPREKKTKAVKILENMELKPGDVVRGRMFTPEKPSTFNKLWTTEEQARLEELLKIYPDEQVASHRWSKIAEALGNRTPRQVASRTQKYFQKLAKQAKQPLKPIPSPEPSTSKIKIKKKRKVNQANNEDYYFPPPVSMPEDGQDQDDDSSSGNSFNETLSTINAPSPAQSSSTPNSQLEGQTEDYSFSEDDDLEFKMISSSLDPELKDTPEYKELLELMKLKHSVATKQKETIHEGYKCDSCGVEPIIGSRFKCIQCDEVAKYGPTRGVDLCQKCKEENYYETEYHSKHHEYQKIDDAESIPYYLDHYMGVDTPTNYLDPKFMPM